MTTLAVIDRPTQCTIVLIGTPQILDLQVVWDKVHSSCGCEPIGILGVNEAILDRVEVSIKGGLLIGVGHVDMDGLICCLIGHNLKLRDIVPLGELLGIDVVSTAHSVVGHVHQHYWSGLIDESALQTGWHIEEGIVKELYVCVSRVEVESATYTKERAHIGEDGIGDVDPEWAGGALDQPTTL